MNDSRISLQSVPSTSSTDECAARVRPNARLLLVEDDRELAEAVLPVLRAEGYSVDHVSKLCRANAAIYEERYDCVILDRTMPDGDGLDSLRHWRAAELSVPAIVLTARAGLDDRVDGLDAGADDYLSKPFALRELLARIKALLRRPGGALGVCLTLANVALDAVRRRLTICGRRLNVPRRELAILELLMRHAGSVVDRDSVMRAAYAPDEHVSSNVLDSNLSRLRQRLAENGGALEIGSIRGVGYILRELA